MICSATIDLCEKRLYTVKCMHTNCMVSSCISMLCICVAPGVVIYMAVHCTCTATQLPSVRCVCYGVTFCGTMCSVHLLGMHDV